PVLSIDKVLNEATPPVAVTDFVPPSVPAPGLLPRLTEILVVLSPVTTFSNASNTRTWTLGAIAVPATVVLGWTWKPRWVAAAGEMVKLPERALISPVALAESV